MQFNLPIKKILFLDIDGVLNGHERLSNGYCGIKPSCVTQLNRILSSVPDLQIVVHSAWRYLIYSESMTIKGFESMMLTHGLNCFDKIIDITRRDLYFTTNDRANQILEYVTKHVPEKWLAIDDLQLDLGDSQVKTNSEIGLTEEQANTIIGYFNDAPSVETICSTNS